MRIRHMSVYTCNSEGWKNYSIRVNCNLYLLLHIMRMIILMDTRRAENATTNRRKERGRNVLFWDVMLTLAEWFSAF